MNILDLFLYLGCFLLSSIFISIGIKRSFKLFTVIGLSIPIAVASLRYYVGTDYGTYLYIHELLSNLNFFEYLSLEDNNIEPGYYALIQVVNLIGLESWFSLAVSSAITIIVAYIAIKKLAPQSTAIAFFLYLTILLPFTFNGVRQGIAMSLIMLALSYALTSKPVKYTFSVLLASMFHLSALLMLPLYFIRKFTAGKKLDGTFALLVIMVISIGVSLLLPVLLPAMSSLPIIGDYMHYDGRSPGLGVVDIAFKLVTVLIVVVTFKRASASDSNMKTFAFLAMLELASISLSSISSVFIRISYYLSIAGILYLSNLPKLATSARWKILTKALLVLFGVAVFTVTYYLAGYSEIFPYKTIFESESIA